MAFNTASFVKVAVAVIVIVIVAVVIAGPGIIGDTTTLYTGSTVTGYVTTGNPTGGQILTTGLTCSPGTYTGSGMNNCVGNHDAGFRLGPDVTVKTGAQANGDVRITIRPAANSFTGVVPIVKLVPLILMVGLLSAGGVVAYRKYGRRR